MSSNVIPVYIGYDSKEPAAYHVLSHSIHKYSSMPVSITPIKISQLTNVYTRPRAENHSTEFSLSRFLAPWLNGFNGWCIFMDCDMLCRVDIANLWDLRNDAYDVMCVKHNYIPKSDSKMLGAKQTQYAKKNWSSLMLMNTRQCFNLTPRYVNDATGLQLHQFHWLSDDSLIGELPLEWNWLVGEYDYNKNAKMVHFTNGGPWWESYAKCDYADEWTDMAWEAMEEKV